MPPLKGSKIRQYSKQDLFKALDAVDKRKLSMVQAARRFKIPRSTLTTYYENRNRSGRSGPSLTFTDEEEQLIVDWAEDLRYSGMVVRRVDVLEAAQWILETYPRQNKMKDNTPSISWVRSFERRHPEVTPCLQSESDEKADTVDARTCFEEVFQYIHSMEIFDEPGRVFKYNEFGFGFSFNIASYFEKQQNGIKRADLITSGVISSAAGRLAFPMIVYPYRETVPLELATTVPLFYGCGNSPSGMMTKETFYNYVTKVFYKYLKLNKVVFPVILFVDGNRPNVSLELWQACRKLEIILLAFNPEESRNSKKFTACVTPLTRVVKSEMDDALLRWKEVNSDKFISDMNFTELLRPAMQHGVTEDLIRRDWKACPFYLWIQKRRNRVEEIEFVSADGTEADQGEEEIVEPPTEG